MILKKCFAALLALCLLTGCTGTDQSEKADAEETEEPAVKENIAKQYKKLNEDNHFEVTEKETLTSILSHGTAIVFLGFPECPWCQAYIPLLEDVLAEQDALCSYYNIYNDKGSDREFYDSVADLLVSQNDTGTDAQPGVKGRRAARRSAEKGLQDHPGSVLFLFRFGRGAAVRLCKAEPAGPGAGSGHRDRRDPHPFGGAA